MPLKDPDEEAEPVLFIAFTSLDRRSLTNLVLFSYTATLQPMRACKNSHWPGRHVCDTVQFSEDFHTVVPEYLGGQCQLRIFHPGQDRHLPFARLSYVSINLFNTL